MAGGPTKRVNSAPLKAIAAETKMNYRALAEVIGVSPSAVSEWLNGGLMPAYMALVIETLQRRQGRSALPALYLLTCPRKSVTTIEPVVRALGGQLTEVKI